MRFCKLMDSIGRFFLAPMDWDPACTTRARKLKAPAYGLHDAPVAFHRSPKRHVLTSELSMKSVGLRRQASTFDPCVFFVFRDQWQAVGALATHIDDISGRGEPDVLTKIRHFLEKRFGTMKLQEDSFVRVGIELV